MEQYSGLYGIEAKRIDFYPFHINPNLRIVYVLKGSIRLRWVSGEQTLTERQVEIININEPVKIEKTESDNLLLIFEFNAAKAKTYYHYIDRCTFNCNCAFFFSAVTEEQDQTILKKMLRIIYHYYITNAAPVVMEKAVEELILFISDRCYDLKNMFKGTSCYDMHAERLLRISIYLFENLHKKISLKEIADIEYLSTQYLSKEFNNKLENNFRAILDYYRITQSIRYLISSNMPVTLISELCGFSAPRYFYKQFSFFMKCTPTEFRNTFLNRKRDVKLLPVNHISVREAMVLLEENDSNLQGMELANNSVLNMMKNRKSCRAFKNVKIPEETLRSVLEAAVCAPSSGGFQNYSIIRIMNPETKSKLAEYSMGQRFIEKAPVDFVFCIDLQREKRIIEEIPSPSESSSAFSSFVMTIADVAVCAQNLCLAAESKGLGTVFIGNIFDHADKVSELLELPDRVAPVIMVAMGYPKGPGILSSKYDAEYLIHDEKYQNRETDEIIRRFRTKYAGWNYQPSDRVIKKIKETAMELVSGDYAEECIKRIEKDGFIDVYSYFMGYYYANNPERMSNRDYIEFLKKKGLNFFD